MSDLVERQAAISLAGDLQIHGDEYHMYNQAINNYCTEIIGLPSAQPEQKIGYWIPVHPLQTDDEGAYLCSNCNTGDWDIKPTDKYCKFCGAKMQGVKKHDE